MDLPTDSNNPVTNTIFYSYNLPTAPDLPSHPTPTALPDATTHLPNPLLMQQPTTSQPMPSQPSYTITLRLLFEQYINLLQATRRINHSQEEKDK